MADMHTCSSDDHRDISKAEIKRGQQYVNTTMQAFSNFLEPFDSSVDRSKLYNIFSGAPVLADIETDLLTAEKQGGRARSNLVNLRLKKKKVDFFEQIKRINLMTMASEKRMLNLHVLKAKWLNTSTWVTL